MTAHALMDSGCIYTERAKFAPCIHTIREGVMPYPSPYRFNKDVVSMNVNQCKYTLIYINTCSFIKTVFKWHCRYTHPRDAMPLLKKKY